MGKGLKTFEQAQKKYSMLGTNQRNEDCIDAAHQATYLDNNHIIFPTESDPTLFRCVYCAQSFINSSALTVLVEELKRVGLELQQYKDKYDLKGVEKYKEGQWKDEPR